MPAAHPDIKSFILKALPRHERDIVQFTADHFGVSRTAVHHHLNMLIKNGQIVKTGTTKQTRYYISTSLNQVFTFTISKRLDEFSVYSTYIQPIFQDLPENIADIIHYGFTEIFNNAIDHSQGRSIVVNTHWDKDTIIITIVDNGIGIFKKFYDSFNLDDMRQSIIQLTKGKITTDPAHHSGEGIFFTSKTFDKFTISSNNLTLFIDNSVKDWYFESSPEKSKNGTSVRLEINRHAKTVLKSIFAEYTNSDDFQFDKTVIKVSLSKFQEETFISRSQAKRVLSGLEKFSDITLDFKGVRAVGQGFIDETFRVFVQKYPHINLHYVNANDDVEFMIKRNKSPSP